MNTSNTTIAAMRKIVAALDLDSKYGYIGIRTQEMPFELGEMAHVSRVWEDGEETDAELPGVCVTSINSCVIPQYYGEHIAIVCGNNVEYGEDVGELIITDPVVEYIVA